MNAVMELIRQPSARRRLAKQKQAARDREVYGERNRIRARRPRLLKEAAAKREAAAAKPAAVVPSIPPLMRTRRNSRGVRCLVPAKAKRYVLEHAMRYQLAK